MKAASTKFLQVASSVIDLSKYLLPIIATLDVYSVLPLSASCLTFNVISSTISLTQALTAFANLSAFSLSAFSVIANSSAAVIFSSALES